MKKYQNAQNREPATGLTQESREVSIKILNELLSDEFVLLVQTLNYHWNLVGPQFNDYHKLFDSQYHAIFEFTDEIAERVRAVGGIAHGSMSDFIKTATLKEDTGDIPQPTQMIENLLQQHEKIIKRMRNGVNETGKDNGDMGTNNFLTDLMAKHEKMAWMLRSLTVK